MKTRRRKPASKRLNALEAFFGRRTASISSITGGTVHCISEIPLPDAKTDVVISPDDTIVVDASKVNHQMLVEHVAEARCGVFIHDGSENIQTSSSLDKIFLNHILHFYVNSKLDFLPRVLRETLLHINSKKPFHTLKYCHWGHFSSSLKGSSKEICKNLKQSFKELGLSGKKLAPHKNILKDLNKACIHFDELKIHLDGTLLQISMNVQCPVSSAALVATLQNYKNAIVLIHQQSDESFEIIAVSDMSSITKLRSKKASGIIFYKTSSEQLAAVKEAS